MYPDPPHQPADFPQVFAEELLRIQAWRNNRGVSETDSDPPLNLIGLALSGGGIRSATFNLGVLQALAKLEILHYVDYLSTVSGGGYIGGWLTAMVHRLAGGMKDVEAGLDPDQVSRNNLPQKAIAHLRGFSNYLTPKVAILSADTWSLFTIWSRNTMLNLATLVAGTAALILLGRFVGLTTMVNKPWAAPFVCVWAAFALAAVTTALTLKERLPRKYCKDAGVQRLVVLPAFAGAVLVTFHVYAHPIHNWVLGGAILSLLFLVMQVLGGFWGWFLYHHEQKSAPFWNGLLQVSVATVSGFITIWLFDAVSGGVTHFVGQPFAPWLVLTAGPPAMLAAVSLGVVVNIGLMGRDLPDSTREWVGRLGAWAMIYGAIWLLFFALAFLGPLGLKTAWSAFAVWAKATITLAWLGTTIGGLAAANSNKTGSDQSHGTMNLIALIGPWAFMLGFVSLIGLGVHELTLGTVKPATLAAAAGVTAPAEVTQSGSTITVTFNSQGGPKKVDISPWDKYWAEMNVQVRSSLLWRNPYDKGEIAWYKGLLEVALLALAIALVMAWRVDINEFSLHHFYKNRLVRCYLGASRERLDRHASPFTNFDLNDDFPLNHLDDPGFSGPFPIINSTLNLSSGRNLAWQERKGAPFIFTPVYSGYDTGKDRSGTSASRHTRVGGATRPGYYPTQLVAKVKYEPEPPVGIVPPADSTPPRFASDGIRLGTTVAISGAAASPNQGYHTSTAVAFLMTVFNVRLGWWLGNPAGKAASLASPAFGLGYTLAELFGTTSAESAFVNLSDGGHFDNTGLYELVRRRCSCIVVCDAEHDATLAFGGFSAAIRMCRTDFGAKIEIDLTKIARKPDNKPESFSGCHYAVGDITYADGSLGKLVYLKSSLTGDEPADVLGYHNCVPQFPHESTADQWFEESQFESYRALGYHIASKTLAPFQSVKSRAALFVALPTLRGCVDPPQPAADQS
jgi:hypothetical protein